MGRHQTGLDSNLPAHLRKKLCRAQRGRMLRTPPTP